MYNTKMYRRSLHRIPELSLKEVETSKYIQRELKKLNFNPKEILGTGVYAYVDNGKEETVCFRADMDALPISEENEVEYCSSNNGVMHACGHDGHMAIMLGFAKYLSCENKESIKYNIMLLFQPAEETYGGALRIIKTGFFKEYNIKKIYGIHLMPFFEEHKVVSKSGELMASATEIDIEILGKSAHIAKPEDGINALNVGCKFVVEISKRLKEKIKEEYIFGIGKIESGTVRNIISGSTRCEGTYRTFSVEVQREIKKELEFLKDKFEEEYKVSINMDIRDLYPPVINNSKSYAEFKRILEKKFDYEEMEEPFKLAEDFSFYGDAAESVFYYIGTKNDEKGFNYPLHNERFNFSEEVLETGVKTYIEIINNI